MDKQAPLIIIGAGRSGSTLLKRALDAHPDISCYGETDFLVPRIWAQVHGNLFWYNWQRKEDLGSISAREPLVPVGGIEMLALRRRLGLAVATLFCDVVGVSPAAAWGFKELWNGSPAHDHPWTSYDAVFPRATWVHLIRHPFDFARSCAQWNDQSLDRAYLCARLADWVAILGRSRERAATGRFLEVRYEEMVADPKAGLSRILARIGLGWSDACGAVFAHDVFRSAAVPGSAMLEKGEVQALAGGIENLLSRMAELGYTLPERFPICESEAAPRPPIPNLRLDTPVPGTQAECGDDAAAPGSMKSTLMPDSDELRFAFGKNWQSFVKRHYTQERIQEAQKHLLDFLKLPSLEGKSFLDIGCGSGLHSLAACRAQATKVYSFDYDVRSVAATTYLRRREHDPANWTIEQGSVLDAGYLAKLPLFDIVYSWGVLHHTGDQWNAIRNAASKLAPGGILYIALYTKGLYVEGEQFWLDLKRRYNESGSPTKLAIECWYAHRVLRGLWRSGVNPVKYVMQYKKSRGMSFWHDVRDWVGGWPMEFSSPEEVQTFARDELGLQEINITTGQANTEYLFCKPARSGWSAQETIQ